MDELMLLSTYLPWVRHQIGRLFAGPLSSDKSRAAATRGVTVRAGGSGG